MAEPDYFPLTPGLKLIYRHTSTEFSGDETVELTLGSLARLQDAFRAQVVLTRRREGKVTIERFFIRRDAKGLASESGVLGLGRLEFPLPPVLGAAWIEEPDRHEIAALDAVIQTPAGIFARCLRVQTLLAGGDSGSAVRYYAPAVGFVHEEYSSETWSARATLTAYSVPIKAS